MSLCENCVWKGAESCFKAVILYPNAIACASHIPQAKTYNPPSSEPAKVESTERRVFSEKEPKKCIFYSNLPREVF